jgi:hypothetical protein
MSRVTLPIRLTPVAGHPPMSTEPCPWCEQPSCLARRQPRSPLGSCTLSAHSNLPVGLAMAGGPHGPYSRYWDGEADGREPCPVCGRLSFEMQDCRECPECVAEEVPEKASNDAMDALYGCDPLPPLEPIYDEGDLC